jgi:hypothetical protein
VGVGVSPLVGCHEIAEVLSSVSPFKKRFGNPRSSVTVLLFLFNLLVKRFAVFQYYLSDHVKLDSATCNVNSSVSTGQVYVYTNAVRLERNPAPS